MKPAVFAYERPSSVADALNMLAEEPGARPIAGGQSLGPMLNLRLATPSLLVDISRLDELTEAGTDADPDLDELALFAAEGARPIDRAANLLVGSAERRELLYKPCPCRPCRRLAGCNGRARRRATHPQPARVALD